MNRQFQRSTQMLVVLIAGFGLAASACGSDKPTASGGNGGSELGAQVYASSCASCHGTDLKGTDKGPSHLSIVYEPNHHPDESFRSAIENGAAQHHWSFGNMEPIEGLSSDEVDAVIAYVRAEQERQGFEQ